MTGNGGHIIKSSALILYSAILANLRKTQHGYGILLKTANRHHAANLHHTSNKGIQNYFRRLNTQTLTKKVPEKQLSSVILRRTNEAKTTTNRPRSTAIRHNVPFPAHLPDIPPKQRKRIDISHAWHIRMNHTSPKTLSTMSWMPTRYGLYNHLISLNFPIDCHGYAIRHKKRASCKHYNSRPPPDNTLVTDIADLIPQIQNGHR